MPHDPWPQDIRPISVSSGSGAVVAPLSPSLAGWPHGQTTELGVPTG